MELLKAELLGTVSHEQRSPPAPIKGYAATLLMNHQDDFLSHGTMC
jgi:signal transduction histidine kinase